MFTKLLVPLDRSALAERAVGTADALAHACQADIDVVLVHRPDDYTPFGDALGLEDSRLRDERKYVTDIATELATDGSISTTHAVLKGDVVPSIVDRARAVRADLIVMTSHGRTGLSRAWLGSVADGLIRHSAIPVLVLRPTKDRTQLVPHNLFRTILVPLDGSPEALEVLDAATALARSSNARLVLLRVVQPVPLIAGDAMIGYVYPSLMPDEVATAGVVEEAKQYIAGIAHGLAQKGFADVAREVIVASSVAQEVLDFARNSGADLITMSTHGRGASRLLIGSVADKVVRGSGLPVLLYHPAAARNAPRKEMPRVAYKTPPFSIA